jgi:hypothetical protein
VVAASESRSYAEASRLLKELAELEVSAKQCQRVAQRVGAERLEERQRQSEAYESLPLPQQQKSQPATAPANSWEGRVATVIVDGGRAQVRDERWGTPKPPGQRRNWWREPKVACLATFLSRPQEHDPLPEIPACLLDPLWVIPRVQEMKRSQRGERGETTQSQRPTAIPTDWTAVLPPSSPERWSPEPLVRTVVATFGPYQRLGPLAAAEAWYRGFALAPRKAFLGDGHLANWSLHQQQFSHYTPIADLMHALSYVYTAALESTREMESCWRRYCGWARQVWQGGVEKVLAELEALAQAAHEDSAAGTLHECLTYLRHNAPRMRYDQYRRMGLPITTTLIESTVKQINRRMKGTEKFWGPGGEAQLQLCSDRLSQTAPLEQYWQRHATHQTGFRKHRAKT